MRLQLFLILTFLLLPQDVLPQSPGYDEIAEEANDEYIQRHYRNAADKFSEAFAVMGGKGYAADRYTAAKCWAQLNIADSAFFNLQKLADKTNYLEYNELITDPEFNNLHKDERWQRLLNQINPLKEIYNDSLAKILMHIYDKDQYYRKETGKMRQKYGPDAPEIQMLWDTISYYDSINLATVTQIIDQYGWLSSNQVGKKGNTALFLVIQHAPLAVQEKYFPIMQKAVEEHKATRTDLAYLEDRILMRNGKKQLYGTQYKINPDTDEPVLWDVEDPENLNKRRASVGMPPLKD